MTELIKESKKVNFELTFENAHLAKKKFSEGSCEDHAIISGLGLFGVTKDNFSEKKYKRIYRHYLDQCKKAKELGRCIKATTPEASVNDDSRSSHKEVKTPVTMEEILKEGKPYRAKQN